MKCKNCQTELEEGVTLCPNCGTENAEPVEVVEPTPAAEPVKTSLGAGKIALLVVLAVVAIAVIAVLIMSGKNGTTPAGTTEPALSGESTPAASDPTASVPTETVPMTIPADGNPDDVTCKGSYSVAEGETFNAEAVVATMGDSKLTNADLQIYYWMGVYDFLNQFGGYASMFGLDYAQPMDMQLSIDGKLTWQQYFLDSALKTWANYQAMYHEAEANSFVLGEEYATYLKELPDTLEKSAGDMGYENAEAMLQGDMGPGATMDSYMNYLNTYYLGYTYYGEALEQMAVTDAEVEAYFDEHAAEYLEKELEKTDDRYVDVRHILIQPESAAGDGTYTEDEWAAAEKKAKDVLNEWLSKEPNENSFASLAGTYSMDPGSASNGGLYEDVYEGQMVKPFEEWCFDETRKEGDYGIVKTDYGYHIMYYVGSDLVWFQTAEADMMAEKGNAFLEQILEKNPSRIDYAAIQIGGVKLGTEG